MCTVSWECLNGGYELVFNRDELRTRPEALAPKQFVDASGVSYMAPIDPRGGGSWFASNAYGLSICILNHYSAQSGRSTNFRSRGQLLLDLAGSKDLDELEARLSRSNGDHLHRAYRLLAFARNEEAPRSYKWDELEIERQTSFERRMLTSSSFDTVRVTAARERLYDLVQPEGLESMIQFQSRSLLESTAMTIRMSRPDAKTVSQIIVRVSPSSVEMKYRSRNEDLGFKSILGHLKLPLIKLPSQV